jgi:hypothetical protein
MVSRLAALALTTTAAVADDVRAQFPLIDTMGLPPAASDSIAGPEPWLDPHALAAAIASLPMSSERGRPSISTEKPSALPTTKWNRTENKDGSAKVTVNRGLDVGWDTKIGADFGVAEAPDPAQRPDLLFAPQDASTGAAWAQVAVPAIPLGWDKASIDARVDSGKEQGKLSTTFSRSLPVNGSFTVTLQNSYSITQSLATAGATPVPPINQTTTSTVPAPGQPHIWATEPVLKFKLAPTDTTFSAGTSLSSADNQWHHQFGAEQKIFGPLNITTSVTDPGTATSNKKITAGFKATW